MIAECILAALAGWAMCWRMTVSEDAAAMPVRSECRAATPGDQRGLL